MSYSILKFAILFQFNFNSLHVRSYEIKMQCRIFCYFVVYLSIGKVRSNLISTPYMRGIRADYCDKLKELNNDSECRINFKEQKVYTKEYKLIFDIYLNELEIKCLRADIDNITLVQLSANNSKVQGLIVKCPRLNWRSNDFMRLLNLNEIEWFEHSLKKNQYRMEKIEEYVTLLHGPINLALEIDSIPSIPTENLTLFRHYNNVTILELTTSFEQLPSDFLKMFFPKLEEITWIFKRFCLPTQKMFIDLKQLSIININIIDDDNFIEDSSDFIDDLSPTILESCKDMHFINMTKLRKVRLKDHRSDKQKSNSPLNFTENFLFGAKNLEVFEVFGFNLFPLPKNIFKDQQNILQIIFKQIKWVPIGNNPTFRDWFEFLRFSSEHTHLEYIEINAPQRYRPGFIQGDNLFGNYSKLKILQLNDFPGIGFPRMKSFICRDDKPSCSFNLDVNDNTCPDRCTCELIHMSMKFIIECNRARYKKIPQLPIPITGSPALYFERNMLETLPPKGSLYGYSNLEELHLANNNLTHLSFPQLPPKITYLDVSNNSLETLNEDVMRFLLQRDQFRLKIKLAGNPWRCDCSTKPLLKFVKNMTDRIDDLVYIYCSDKSLGLLINLQEEAICFSFVPYFSIFLGVLLVLATIVIIIQINMQRFLIWLYEHNMCLCWVTREELDKDKIFDAFLAYSHKDSEKVPEFVFKLENGPRKFRLCFYDRDWLIGVPIPESICRSVEDSKRIIILFTKNFIQSSWGRLEFRLAIRATSKDKCKRLIVIRYPDVNSLDDLDSELRNYMTLNTYLNRNDSDFWNKLIYAMPHNSRTSKLRGIKQSESRV